MPHLQGVNSGAREQTLSSHTGGDRHESKGASQDGEPQTVEYAEKDYCPGLVVAVDQGAKEEAQYEAENAADDHTDANRAAELE